MFKLFLVLAITLFSEAFQFLTHTRALTSNKQQQYTRLYNSPNNSSFLAPVNDLSRFNRNSYNSYNDFEDDNEQISKNFIPTGPQSLAPYEKTYKNENVMKPKSETTRKYFEIVEKLSPNDLLQKFAETAPRPVQVSEP